MHKHSLDERYSVPFGVKEGKKVGNIPHEEENAQRANEGGTGDAGNFKCRRVAGRGDKKNSGALQIKKGDNADQDAGDEY